MTPPPAAPWEPTPEAVEEKARELCELVNLADDPEESWSDLDEWDREKWLGAAKFILLTQHAAVEAALFRLMEAAKDVERNAYWQKGSEGPTIPQLSYSHLSAALAELRGKT